MQFDYYEIRPCVERAGHVKSFLGEPQWCEERGGHIRTPEAALEEARKYRKDYGGKLFWTIYGMDGEIATAIGDFKSFDAAFEVMNAILAPMAAARDTLEAGATGSKLCRMVNGDLEDIILQSSTRERI